MGLGIGLLGWFHVHVASCKISKCWSYIAFREGKKRRLASAVSECTYCLHVQTKGEVSASSCLTVQRAVLIPPPKKSLIMRP